MLHDNVDLQTADRRTADRGSTLVELIVVMGILTFIVAIFMAGVVIMTKNTATAQSVSDSSDQIRRTFQRFDKDVRYASAINRPGYGADGNYYIEYVVRAQQDGGDPVCTQWRYVPADRALERRTWTEGGSAPGWQMVAGNVRNDLTDPGRIPFQFSPADVTYQSQRLRVVLDIGPGAAGADARRGAGLDTTFSARNTSTSSVTNPDVDNNGVSDTQVCLTGASRS